MTQEAGHTSLIIMAGNAGSISIHLPDSRTPPGQWTAEVQSPYLSQLPHSVYESSSSSQSFPRTDPQLGSQRHGLAAHLLAASSSAALPDSQSMLSSSQSASQAAAGYVNGQRMIRHLNGMQVQSDLQQGGTITALLELLIGVSNMQRGLRKMRHLMNSQHQQLQHVLTDPRAAPNLPSTIQLPHAVAVKEEAPASLLSGTCGNASSPRTERTTQIQNLSSEQPGDTAPTKPEFTEEAGLLDGPGNKHLPTSGRRRSSQKLAWHVVSSGVVQIAEARLSHAVLEVRPPPPWATCNSTPTASAVKVEAVATDAAGTDVDMLDAERPSTTPRTSFSPTQLLPQQPSSTARQSLQLPAPYLTLRMHWALAQPSASESQPSFSAAEPASMAVPQPQIVAPRGSQSVSAAQAQQQPTSTSALDAAQQSEDLRLRGEDTPVLRCCMQSEPQLPSKVLESFQDMAGVRHNLPFGCYHQTSQVTWFT